MTALRRKTTIRGRPMKPLDITPYAAKALTHQMAAPTREIDP